MSDPSPDPHSRVRDDAAPRPPRSGMRRREYRPLGWRPDSSLAATLKRTVAEFREDNLTDGAAALTYYGVLSLFPALIALVSIVGLFGDPADDDHGHRHRHRDRPGLRGGHVLRPDRGHHHEPRNRRDPASRGLAAALWSASGYVGAFMRASNAICETPEGRSFLKLRPLQLAVTLLVILLLPSSRWPWSSPGRWRGRSRLDRGSATRRSTIWDIAKWPVLAAMVLLASRRSSTTRPRTPSCRASKWVTAGSLLALVVWLIASAGFAFYVSNFGSYNKTYGTPRGHHRLPRLALDHQRGHPARPAELNAERERSREIEEGRPRAEREIQLEPRDEPRPPRSS